MIVDVVIVTYNRLEKLKKTLQCYERQTQPFRNMIVVNNHSTDGTTEFLAEWAKLDAPFAKHVITTDENLGGSGGYYIGQKKAMELNPDWVFLADDDAYPSSDLIEQFIAFSSNHDVSSYSAICGTVYYIDGSINYKHRSTYSIKQHRLYNRQESVPGDYLQEYFKIDFLSYVGAFINSAALIRVGLVNPDYFIFYDDSEHSMRLRKYGELVCVPAIRIVHDEWPETAGNKAGTISWKDYYFIRNEMHMLKKHHILSAFHKTRICFSKKGRLNAGLALDKLQRVAICDAWLNRLGKHAEFKPGWNPDNQAL